ncbi:dipeptide epimerase [Rhodoblastus acidophilus]|uniref:Dipeptide epimerase n=1 Tax=Candidatus Rhodoblastus alkanivorans TaxID=2954117 RepID=A0ABS9Z7B8_9HYPH|nr:N-acetyl-D-Glu racemase DgcA [Candidatus Rhodoblastus alkanivorans]MCI4680227.1 dipeptide epimerase [Candidatus Rhodoblastus alkanivorans]MCI4683330.1 dipeptide epimerase [Candidatus Rhodoblastus alkanivorans]MDI4640643.1 dipeptide epimerase [Rhodoblastus acidophilus]
MTSSEKRRLSLDVVRFPLKNPFVISRGAKTEAVTVVATVSQGPRTGRGECTPYSRYGESVDSVAASIESARDAIEAGADRAALQKLLPAGAARNALDCALWDLEAKICGVPAFQMAGLHRLAPCVTAFTLSVGTPEDMARAAEAAASRPVLKVKLAGEGDAARVAAVRAAAPESELIVDANEAWRPENLEENFAACAAAGVALVEQPLPAGADSALAGKGWPVSVCADESVHDRKGLADLRDRYDVINIKLDKTGGLTEALALADEAEKLGFGLLIGCMVASSLAMAPAMLLASRARFVDLDGPLLLAEDHPHGLRYEGSTVFPPERVLWG